MPADRLKNVHIYIHGSNLMSLHRLKRRIALRNALLQHVVKRMHGVIAMLQLKLAREKTYIGRIARGFEFLGYRFTHQGLVGLARKTIVNFIGRLSRLYKSGATTSRIAQYVQHWQKWCTAGL